MYWYDFGRLDVYVGKGGRYNDDDVRTISLEKKEKIAKLFDEHLLKIYYTDESSYDNSDDDRASDSYHSSRTYVYRQVNVKQDLFGIVMNGDEVVGIAYYVNNNRRDTYVYVFYFSNNPKSTMTLGYSASHSSNFTTVYKVELVKKGENNVPTQAKEMSFIQGEMYPDI